MSHGVPIVVIIFCICLLLHNNTAPFYCVWNDVVPVITFLLHPHIEYLILQCVVYKINTYQRLTEWTNGGYFRPQFCTARDILRRGQPGRTLIWNMPQVQDQSFNLLTYNKAHYHCVTAAPSIHAKLHIYVKFVNNLKFHLIDVSLISLALDVMKVFYNASTNPNCTLFDR